MRKSRLVDGRLPAVPLFLLMVQAGIFTVLIHQVGVGTILDDFTAGENKDPICQGGRPNSMCFLGLRRIPAISPQ